MKKNRLPIKRIAFLNPNLPTVTAKFGSPVIGFVLYQVFYLYQGANGFNLCQVLDRLDEKEAVLRPG